MAKKKKLFNDSPDGIQLHAGHWKGEPAFHSGDGGKTWWCGFHFEEMTRHELVELAESLARDLREKE